MNLNSRNLLKGSINKIWLFVISMLYGLNAFAGLGGITIGDTRVDQWQWFTLNVNMNGEDVHHFEATLSYDPQMLVVKEVNEGNFLNPTGEEETVWSAPEIDEKAGTIQIAGSLEKLAQPVSGWGQIAKIVLEPLAVGETVVAATNLAVFNQLGDDITPENVGLKDILGSSTITVDLYHQVAEVKHGSHVGGRLTAPLIIQVGS